LNQLGQLQNNQPAITRAAQSGMGVSIIEAAAGGRWSVPIGAAMDQEGVLEIKTPELELRW